MREVLGELFRGDVDGVREQEVGALRTRRRFRFAQNDLAKHGEV